MTQDGGARRNGTASVAGSAVSASRTAAQEDKVQRVVVEGLWKQVLEPALEYTRVSPPSGVKRRCVHMR